MLFLSPTLVNNEVDKYNIREKKIHTPNSLIFLSEDSLFCPVTLTCWYMGPPLLDFPGFQQVVSEYWVLDAVVSVRFGLGQCL